MTDEKKDRIETGIKEMERQQEEEVTRTQKMLLEHNESRQRHLRRQEAIGGALHKMEDAQLPASKSAKIIVATCLVAWGLILLWLCPPESWR